MKTQIPWAFAWLVALCVVSASPSAGGFAMPIDVPSSTASADERPVEQAERIEHCSKLMQEGQLLRERFPTILLNTEAVSHSAKYGYILRYARVESVLAPDGKSTDIYSRFVLFTSDCGKIHTVVDYS